MAKEFYACCVYKMSLPGNLHGVSGGIILPVAIARHTLERRNLDRHRHLRRRLLDPQVYLAGLNATVARAPCANLASYGWFPVEGLQTYDSGEQKQSDWNRTTRARIHRMWPRGLPSQRNEVEAAIGICLHVQQQLNCENVILPSPLTVDLATDYSDEVAWLDAGLRVSERFNSGALRLASVAISDSCLRQVDPWQNSLIDLVIDQVSSRDPDGVYIVLEQSSEGGYYCVHPNTVGAALRLVYGFKAAGLSRVVVACSGLVGFLSLLVGADTWSTGWYKSQRRLSLTEIEGPSGRAYPAYYSHHFAGEFHLDSDLDRACASGYLDRLRDVTPASEGLIGALDAGRTVADVAEWEYRLSNVQACQEHFLRVLVRETERISELGQGELLDYGLNWLEEAEDLAMGIAAMGDLNPRTDVSHQAAWYQALQAFVANTT